MPHWRTMIEKDHLGAWDLVGPDGKTPKDYTLEIAAVQQKKLRTKDQPDGKGKIVITFKGARKKMVCNATNGETIESLYGPYTEKWIGQKITLFQTKVRKGRDMVDGIRVRSRAPQGPAEVVPDREVDEEMREKQNEAFGREPGEEG